LDAVVVWDRAEWKRLLRRGRWLEVARRIRTLRHELRGYRADIALDLQGLLRSAWIARLTGAPIRIGLGNKELSWLLVNHRVPAFPTRFGGISAQYPYFAEQIGLDGSDRSLELGIAPADRETAGDALAEAGVPTRFAVAAPFTTRPQKHWVESRWGALIDRLATELDLPTVVLGGPSDRAAAERIRASSKTGFIDLVGLPLGPSGEVIARSSLFIGVDTGMTHAAVALERPTVMIVGSDVPYAEAPHRRARIALHRLPCVPCARRPTCGGDWTCMKAVSVDEVIGLAREVTDPADAASKETDRDLGTMASGMGDEGCSAGGVEGE
ncbi:MAG: glycosyltransferase family 9 protein, partial [Gemmatimonadetes bacterium]|nr:glycosyltransferase family 9 protein [Gemmatimonadota bacterium]